MGCYTTPVIILVVVLSLLCPSHTGKHNIKKRNVFQLAHEILHYLGLGEVYDLMDYGCYCGKGGYGEPMDNLDSCCKAHDHCYGELKQKHYYSNMYDYKFKRQTIECADALETDDRKLCECDKIFVECVLRSEYRSEHHNNCSADNSLYKK
ncbi:PLA2G [Mytilus coruscus]|uniref:Phospholipase A2 n=1 Tax=Mytilus coruscus TaxID=42192 RepID=A0A6J8CF79_MYTCO|nr:PLA2G [Mytilus coruscus]